MESLYDLQKRTNSDYYKKKGDAIYDDFLTFVSRCDKLARANASGFHSFLAENPSLSKARILECGVGDGSFALDFLKELEKLGDISRVEYTLCDFSPKMLSDAQKKLSKFRDVVKTQVIDFSDASTISSLNEKFHYIRMNELLTDLPARVFVRQGKNIFEVYYEMRNGDPAELETEYRRIPNPPEEARAFLLSNPSLESYEIPFNFAAASAVTALCPLLAEDGYIDIFDYGFATLDSILDLPLDMWNPNIVREYGGQVTTDLNFLLIAAAGNAAGLSSRIGTQTDYVQDALKLEIVPLMLEDGLCYFTREEAEKEKKKLEKEGYSLDEIFDREIIADDGFWHLRLEKK